MPKQKLNGGNPLALFEPKPKKTRKKANQFEAKKYEWQIQKEVCEKINGEYKKMKIRLVRVNNAGRFNGKFWVVEPGTAIGFPDLIVLNPKGGFHGLAIELKTSDGKTDKEGNQLEWQEILNNELGWMAVICKSASSAIEIILKYMNGDYTPEKRKEYQNT